MADELAPESIVEFFERFPCDDRAQQYLQSSSETVIQRALSSFKPPREGEADYSALVVAFVRGLRTEEQQGQDGAVEGTDEGDLQAEMEAFRNQFPMDEDAYNYIMNSPPDVQWQVVREFKPKAEGESDYSALIISFTKRCRAAGTIRPAVQHQHVAAQPSRAQPQAQAKREEELLAEVEAFRQRYPMDEQAYNYVVRSAPEVQEQILREFKAKNEGEADYSALVISFAKRCRGQAAGQQRQGDGYGHNGQHSGLRPGEWEAFQQRYPFDEAAANYVNNSPPEVRTYVVRNFKPQREGESDYSALVISYTKRTRQNMANQAPQPSYGAPHGQGQWQQWNQGGGGFGQQASARGYGPGRVELENFRRRFPMDDRAFNYLLDSPPEVRQQVLETFRPPRHDTDYSAPVVGYAKTCRQNFEASFHGGGGGGQGHGGYGGGYGSGGGGGGGVYGYGGGGYGGGQGGGGYFGGYDGGYGQGPPSKRPRIGY